ncbi:hypothetical protein [Zhihengliuella sp.]|uniref:hypothetical protein n=1 Tax=Zhihengliuella sp. TaxID=1954483 RepID=UPI002810BF41|nr:hypothetical protein [Zhihengliuella sp.]
MKAFYDAVVALLPAQSSPQLFTAELSSPPVGEDYPYTVVWGTAPTEFSGESFDDPSLSGDPDAVSLEMRLTYAALSVTSLDHLIKGVHEALVRAKPTVAGYACGPINLRSLLPIQPDRDLHVGGRNPFYAVDEFTLTATRL